MSAQYYQNIKIDDKDFRVSKENLNKKIRIPPKNPTNFDQNYDDSMKQTPAINLTNGPP